MHMLSSGSEVEMTARLQLQDLATADGSTLLILRILAQLFQSQFAASVPLLINCSRPQKAVVFLGPANVRAIIWPVQGASA